MSLYHEAAEVLTAAQNGGGSLKSIVFRKKDWKSDPKTLFALATEAAKWSEVLSEVVEKTDLLRSERQLNPILALLLTHDLLVSQKGVALPQKHGLHVAVTRHKARLGAELTKARLRRGFTDITALRAHVARGGDGGEGENGTDAGLKHPRWVRINTLRTTLDEQLDSTFQGYVRTDSLKNIQSSGRNDKPIYVDEHVPNLIAVPSDVELAASKAYKEGKIILQDKASCFPAYLLDPGPGGGDVMDACAAPGNKTTHLAAILHDLHTTPTQHAGVVIACEKDPARSHTLSTMVKVAGAEGLVLVRSKQDFLRLNPQASEFARVGALLLDPSCSGSGIIGRDEARVTIHLPRAADRESRPQHGKKRKRGADEPPPPSVTVSSDVHGVVAEEQEEQEDSPIEPDAENGKKLADRLKALSSFQQRIVEHAMSFPAARRITYSTCSTHAEENEQVVVRVLRSDVARRRGWRVMARDVQVEGMRRWHRRGDAREVEKAVAAVEEDGAGLVDDPEGIAEACIRCEKGGIDATMGFFVAGFVRLDGVAVGSEGRREGRDMRDGGVDEEGDGEEEDEEDDDDEEWNGFA